jgi:hypothetical protein
VKEPVTGSGESSGIKYIHATLPRFTGFNFVHELGAPKYLSNFLVASFRLNLGRIWECQMHVSSKKIRWPTELLRRADRVASDLNVILMVFAVGLATLDLTFLVTQKLISRLPQVTYLTEDAGGSAQIAPYSFVKDPLQ